jgi:hypothetical protein
VYEREREREKRREVTTLCLLFETIRCFFSSSSSFSLFLSRVLSLIHSFLVLPFTYFLSCSIFFCIIVPIQLQFAAYHTYLYSLSLARKENKFISLTFYLFRKRVPYCYYSEIQNERKREREREREKINYADEIRDVGNRNANSLPLSGVQRARWQRMSPQSALWSITTYYFHQNTRTLILPT